MVPPLPKTALRQVRPRALGPPLLHRYQSDGDPPRQPTPQDISAERRRCDRGSTGGEYREYTGCGGGGGVEVVGEGVLGEVEEREVGGEGEEEGGAGGGQVEEKTGEGWKKAGEGKSVEQDGGDSGRKGGEAGGVRVAWSVQVEEEEMEEEAEIVKSKQTVKRRRSRISPCVPPLRSRSTSSPMSWRKSCSRNHLLSHGSGG